MIRAASLEYRRYDDGHRHGHGKGANGRSDIVGDIIGPDIQRHVSADYRCCDQEKGLFDIGELCSGVDHDADHEQNGRSKPPHFRSAQIGCMLYLDKVSNFHIACL